MKIKCPIPNCKIFIEIEGDQLTDIPDLKGRIMTHLRQRHTWTEKIQLLYVLLHPYVHGNVIVE